MKTILMTTAAAALALGLAACGQGANEEAGEAADSAYEQSTTGTTDLGQGPQEEAGEALDEAQGEAAEGGTTPPAEGTTTTP
jgi:ABC-type glycerol-3-phosphate transport system substrate-binding protein